MKEKIELIKSGVDADLESVKNINDLVNLKAKYLGKKGLVTELTANMKDLSIEERKEVGRVSNEVRTMVTDKINAKEEEVKTKELNSKLEKETIDITLPSRKLKRGSRHPFNRIVEDVEDFFVSMGYDVVDGPELETDENCFQLLNLPLGHPARDAQDTFYIDDEYYLEIKHLVFKLEQCKLILKRHLLE